MRMLNPKEEATKKCGAGKFPCRIINLTRGLSKVNHTEFWEITMEVLEGAFASADVTDSIYFKADTYENEKKARKRAAQFLLDCGFDQIVDLDDGEALWNALVGRTISVTFKEEEEEWVGKDGQPRKALKTRFTPFGFSALDKVKYPDTAAGDTAAHGSKTSGDQEAPDDLPFG